MYVRWICTYMYIHILIHDMMIYAYNFLYYVYRYTYTYTYLCMVSRFEVVFAEMCHWDMTPHLPSQ